MTNNHRKPNRLINQSSPYLLQHAYNPVDWHPWGEDALRKAKQEDKPIIVSIGYSSCHWCHVMERESFENEEIARLMNENFINIKVDREERPDIDQIYMDALQSMNIRGGWPLNVILTPDAKPFYGGTYFPASHWTNLLNQISTAFKEHREELEKSAEDFTRILNYTELQKYELSEADQVFSTEDLERMYQRLERAFDKKWGGMDKEPKFPMPSIWQFLLRYHHISKNESALRQVKLTLDKMAYGGIFDQIGGGFARYSTDGEWFAPHFEKMLYDNGQLLTLYSEAYSLTRSDLYKEVVYETIRFIEREMTDPSGGFYSALDADSEDEEGKFYIWTEDEINEVAGEDAELFKEYYNTQFNGNWEKDYNILNRTLSDQAFANKHKLDIQSLKKRISQWKKTFLSVREQRPRPGLDDKILTSWNGLLLHGLLSAYRVFGEEKFLELAINNARFLRTKVRDQKKLFHNWKNGKASIDGYLEDYASVIHAYIELYQASFQEEWLYEANLLTGYVMEHFYDPLEDMFFFTADNSEKLIARKKEIFDNVIPSSNSMMALNLYKVGMYFENESYIELSKKMIGKIKKLLLVEPAYLANWGILFTMNVKPTAEIAISGKENRSYREMLDRQFLPNVLLAGANEKSELPLLKNRAPKDSQTKIYVCVNKACNLPVSSVEDALKQLEL